ncbi:MAG TPA: hypothetical protein VIZ69_08870 [Thermoanaerobaculia bacterium]
MFVGTGVIVDTGVTSTVGVAAGVVAVAAGVTVPAGVAVPAGVDVTPGVPVMTGVPVGPGVFVRTPMGGGVGPPGVTVGPGGNRTGVDVVAGFPVLMGVGVGPEPEGPGAGSVIVFRLLHRSTRSVTPTAKQRAKNPPFRPRRGGALRMPSPKRSSCR